MICPPDYIPLARLVDRWKDERRDVNLRNLENTFLECDMVTDVEASVSELSVDFPDDLSEEEFLRLVEEHLLIASPDGEVRRVPSKQIREGMQEWSLNVEDLWRAVHQLRRTDILRSPHPHAALDSSLLNEFLLSDLTKSTMTEWLSDARTRNSRISVWQFARSEALTEFHQRLPPFFERIGYTITVRLFDLARELGLECGAIVTKVAADLRPYQGWTLCLPKELEERAKWAGLRRKARQEQARPPKSAGRPSDTSDKFLKVYLSMPRNEREHMTRKGLLKAFREKAPDTPTPGPLSTVDRDARPPERWARKANRRQSTPRQKEHHIPTF